MKSKLAMVILLCLSALPMFAHHSVTASNDSSRLVTIQGAVARVEWLNPHTWITLDVKQADGKVTKERVEIAGPVRLTKTGFDRNYLKIGDVVTIEAWPPKIPGGQAPNGRTLILADGRRFDVSDNWPSR